MVTRGLEGLDREVSGEGPSEEVGQETGGNVEEDAGDENGCDTDDSVGLGDGGLLLEAVESLEREDAASQFSAVE